MREHHYASSFFLYKKILFYPFPSHQKCQKNGHFSSKKHFQVMVLAVTSTIVVPRAYHAAKEDPVGALYKE